MTPTRGILCGNELARRATWVRRRTRELGDRDERANIIYEPDSSMLIGA